MSTVPVVKVLESDALRIGEEGEAARTKERPDEADDCGGAKNSVQHLPCLLPARGHPDRRLLGLGAPMRVLPENVRLTGATS